MTRNRWLLLAFGALALAGLLLLGACTNNYHLTCNVYGDGAATVDAASVCTVTNPTSTSLNGDFAGLPF